MPWTAETLAAQAIADHGRNREILAEAGFSARRVPRFDDVPAASATTVDRSSTVGLPSTVDRPSTVSQPSAVDRPSTDRPPSDDREAFRSQVLALLPDRLPRTGGLRPEERLQAEVVALCHRRIRRDGWACMPFMIPNGVLIPRRGATPEERARDPLPAIIGARLKAMGLVPGLADLGFLLWPTRLAFMELKRPRDGQTGFTPVGGSLRVRAPRKGVTSDKQETFAGLCRLAGWACPAVDTLAQAEAELLSWGVNDRQLPPTAR